MSRKLMAVLVSTALAFGSIGTSAWAGDTAKQTVKNESPLPAAGAAGIKQAQGAVDTSALILGGIVVITIITAILLSEDDQGGGPPTPNT